MDSQITWAWKTQVWASVGTTGYGSVNHSSDWHYLGETVVVQALPAKYHHFVRWGGDVPPGAEGNPTLNLLMDQAKTVSAIFEANVTSRGTPEAWLAQYGWVEQFETASFLDSDADGAPAWAEYVAGTSPVDSNSVLRASISPLSSGCQLSWPSVANRRYSIYRAESLTNGFKLLSNALPATPPINSFNDFTNLSLGLYRIEVTNSP
jgi:hypothetical protein